MVSMFGKQCYKHRKSGWKSSSKSSWHQSLAGKLYNTLDSNTVGFCLLFFPTMRGVVVISSNANINPTVVWVVLSCLPHKDLQNPETSRYQGASSANKRNMPIHHSSPHRQWFTTSPPRWHRPQREIQKVYEIWEFFCWRQTLKKGLKCFSSTLSIRGPSHWKGLNLQGVRLQNTLAALWRVRILTKHQYQYPKTCENPPPPKTTPPHSFEQIQQKMYLKSFCPTKRSAKMIWWSLKFLLKNASNAHGAPPDVFRLLLAYNLTPPDVSLHPGNPPFLALRRWNQGKDDFPKHRDDLGEFRRFRLVLGCVHTALVFLGRKKTKKRPPKKIRDCAWKGWIEMGMVQPSSLSFGKMNASKIF